jgi:uncharacterized protein (TIGR02271 family)
MARDLFSHLDDWKLSDDAQDIRGRALHAPDGRLVGTINDLVADTDTRHVDTAVLDSGAQYPVRDLEITDDDVILRDGRTGTATAQRPPGDRTSPNAQAGRDSIRIPVIEERVKVGKRPVVTGGVVVHTEVEERPVEENVNLRRTEVHVERQKADRPASEEDFAAARRTVEAAEVAEEVVVDKSARVVEEVVITKDTAEKTETVRDTVRKAQPKVDEAAPRPPDRKVTR